MTLPSEDELTAQVRAFGLSIEAARDRWEYCLTRVCHRGISPLTHEIRDAFHGEMMSRVTRLLGRDARSCRVRLGHIKHGGYETASKLFPDMSVAALQPWMLGHVYFARVASHPHVVKVGFSRRVRQRIADVQRQVGAELLVTEVRPGTGADENWWHFELAGLRISGEWFFDPEHDERSVPEFLREREAA